MADAPVKIFFVCSGLGNTRRGYEVFFASLFDKLQDEPTLDITLFKGGGPAHKRQIRLWNLPRLSKAAVWLGKLLRVGTPALGRGYFIEQATFCISLLPYLVLRRPDVVYFSDKNLGDFLGRWKRLSGQSFKLVFRNGGPYPPPYPRFDYVQQLTEPLFQQALDAGCSDTQQIQLPAGFDLAPQLDPLSAEAKTDLRRQLGLPNERPILLCVSAVNSSHKRLDYLLDELAQLPEPRPFLQVLGQFDAESPAIREQAAKQLGAQNFALGSVSFTELLKYYAAADLFVLASVREGFGRVMVEAMAAGLPCLVHDYPISRYVLGEHGYYVDFRQAGALSQLLRQVLAQEPGLAAPRHAAVYERFSWDQLLPRYVQVLQDCANGSSSNTPHA